MDCSICLRMLVFSLLLFRCAFRLMLILKSLVARTCQKVLSTSGKRYSIGKVQCVWNSVDGQVGQGDDTTQHLYSLISSRLDAWICWEPLIFSDSLCFQNPADVNPLCRAMLVEKQETLKTWQRRIAPSISRHLSIESFVEDFASPFLHIITPPNLRPVALNLLSEREKDELLQLVDTMVSYSLAYKYSKGDPQEKMQKPFADTSEDLPLSLDPPISDFVDFKRYQSQNFALSLATNQILVHEGHCCRSCDCSRR